MESLILEKTQSYVEDVFRNNQEAWMYYHNIDHLYDVVEAIKIIGRECRISQDQLEIALMAGWLHDIGYCNKNTTEHEQESITTAFDFLKSLNCEDRRIDTVIGCIKATKVPQQPKTEVERVVCDADMAHLAKEQYFHKAENLRKELSFLKGSEVSEREWLLENLRFFENHSYWTKYGKSILQIGKQKNYNEMMLRLSLYKSKPPRLA